MSAGRRFVAATAAAAVLLLTSPAAPSAQTAPTAAIELMAQSPVTDPHATVKISLRLPGVPGDGSVRLVIHGRVRSRSELDESIDGDGLRTNIFQKVIPLGTLPPAADGTRTISLALDPAAGGPSLSGGVYPLELTASDSANHSLAELVTHLVVPPTGEGSPPLAVAAVARVAAPPVVRTTTPTGALDEAQIESLATLVHAVQSIEGNEATIAVSPETVVGLIAAGDSGEPVVTELRQAAATHPVLAQPYVAISLDALTRAGLSDEIIRQSEAGRRLLTSALETSLVDDIWLPGDDLSSDGLAILQRAGVEYAVVPSTLVEPLPEGVIDLSLAQPFVLDPPQSDPAEGSGTITALEVDPVVDQRLHGEGTAALAANRAIAELATIWFEQPGIARSEVVPLSLDLAAGVAPAFLEGLAGSPVFRPTSLSDAFTSTKPLLDAGDDPVHRALTPADAKTFTPAEAARVRQARSSLESARGMVGADSPLVPPVDAEMLLATADELGSTVRDDQARAVEAKIDDLERTVTGPVSFTLTLTARDGSIPLTLHNDSGVPLNVVVHLDSAKLTFPDGNAMPVVLTDPVTRIDIPVRSRASGALSLIITVTTPDGKQSLVVSHYTVRSTAVAGAGLVLAVGAGLFLLVWWTRHWRTTRRNARLVAAHGHPTTKAEPGG